MQCRRPGGGQTTLTYVLDHYSPDIITHSEDTARGGCAAPAVAYSPRFEGMLRGVSQSVKPMCSTDGMRSTRMRLVCYASGSQMRTRQESLGKRCMTNPRHYILNGVRVKDLSNISEDAGILLVVRVNYASTGEARSFQGDYRRGKAFGSTPARCGSSVRRRDLAADEWNPNAEHCVCRTACASG